MRKARLPGQLTRVRKESGYEFEQGWQAMQASTGNSTKQRRRVAARFGLDLEQRHIRRFEAAWQCQLDADGPGAAGDLLGVEQRNVAGGGGQRSHCQRDRGFRIGGGDFVSGVDRRVKEVWPRLATAVVETNARV